MGQWIAVAREGDGLIFRGIERVVFVVMADIESFDAHKNRLCVSTYGGRQIELSYQTCAQAQSVHAASVQLRAAWLKEQAPH